MATPEYDIFLRGDVGGWDFNADFVEWCVEQKSGQPLHVLVSSPGGRLDTALRVAAAFARHGDVHVHYSGMNASAATVIACNAARVTIDDSAFWLVHRSSYLIDIWKQQNSADLRQLAAGIEASAADLETFDSTLAAMYARRCSKSADELAALMAEDKWLTAPQALEWGFVDEVITPEADREAQPIPRSMVMALHEAGLPPLPDSARTAQPPLMERIIRAVRGAFASSRSGQPADSTPSMCGVTPAADTDPTRAADTHDAPEAHAPAAPEASRSIPVTPQPAMPTVPELQAQLDAANARIAELEAAPAAATSSVVNPAADPAPAADAAPSAQVGRMAAYASEMAQARQLYDALP